MICSYCGDECIWVGSWANLTHTECRGCGAVNAQEVEEQDDGGDVAE